MKRFRYYASALAALVLVFASCEEAGTKSSGAAAPPPPDTLKITAAKALDEEQTVDTYAVSFTLNKSLALEPEMVSFEATRSGTGNAEIGDLVGQGANWTAIVKKVNSSGDVKLTVTTEDESANKTVEITKKPLQYNAYPLASGSQGTSQIIISFSEYIDLSDHNLFVNFYFTQSGDVTNANQITLDFDDPDDDADTYNIIEGPAGSFTWVYTMASPAASSGDGSMKFVCSSINDEVHPVKGIKAATTTNPEGPKTWVLFPIEDTYGKTIAVGMTFSEPVDFSYNGQAASNGNLVTQKLDDVETLLLEAGRPLGASPSNVWTFPLKEGVPFADGDILTIGLSLEGYETGDKTATLSNPGINYQAYQLGGAAGASSTNAICLVFSDNVVLQSDEITLLDAASESGDASLTGLCSPDWTTLSGNGRVWFFNVAPTQTGDISIAVSNANVADAARKLTIYFVQTSSYDAAPWNLAGIIDPEGSRYDFPWAASDCLIPVNSGTRNSAFNAAHNFPFTVENVEWEMSRDGTNFASVTSDYFMQRKYHVTITLKKRSDSFGALPTAISEIPITDPNTDGFGTVAVTPGTLAAGQSADEKKATYEIKLAQSGGTFR